MASAIFPSSLGPGPCLLLYSYLASNLGVKRFKLMSSSSHTKTCLAHDRTGGLKDIMLFSHGDFLQGSHYFPQCSSKWSYAKMEKCCRGRRFETMHIHTSYCWLLARLYYSLDFINRAFLFQETPAHKDKSCRKLHCLFQRLLQNST